jgi:hypothetical protein
MGDCHFAGTHTKVGHEIIKYFSTSCKNVLGIRLSLISSDALHFRKPPAMGLSEDMNNPAGRAFSLIAKQNILYLDDTAAHLPPFLPDGYFLFMVDPLIKHNLIDLIQHIRLRTPNYIHQLRLGHDLVLFDRLSSLSHYDDINYSRVMAGGIARGSTGLASASLESSLCEYG